LPGNALGHGHAFIAALDRRYRIKVKTKVRDVLGLEGATA
jgi:cytochrome c-type biogenesis protein CcmF